MDTNRYRRQVTEHLEGLKWAVWVVAWVLTCQFGVQCSQAAHAAELRLLDPEEVSVEYWKIGNQRDSYLRIDDPGADDFNSEETWAYGAAVNFDFSLVRLRPDLGLYSRNHVHMDATQAAVRHVGWQWELGAEMSKYLDVFWKHHSRHILEDSREDRFPLENHYGVRLIIHRGGK